MLYMKMAFFVGIFLAAPYLLYQVWAFIAPGLYAHEKAYAVPFIVAGHRSSSWAAPPSATTPVPAHLPLPGASSAATDMQFLPKVDEYYSFYSWFLLGLGLVFQLPVVIFVLARIGLVTPGFLLRHFKYAVLAAFVVAAVITPTPDIVTQTLLALPMLGLYLLGVRGGLALRPAAARRPRPRSARKREAERGADDDLLAAGLRPRSSRPRRRPGAAGW